MCHSNALAEHQAACKVCVRTLSASYPQRTSLAAFKDALFLLQGSSGRTLGALKLE